MMRIPGLLLLGLATIAAAPNKGDFSTVAVLDQSALGSSIVPYSSAAPPPATGIFAPAPVPDIDVLAPSARDRGAAAAEVSASLFTPQKTYRGEGYLPGSTVQGSQQRHVNPAPGFSLKVPLE